jgi:hypothetical protein
MLRSAVQKKKPKEEIWVAKGDVTLWSFPPGGGPATKEFFKKKDNPETFILKRKAKSTDYEEETFHWLFQHTGVMGRQGYACRFSFYPECYTLPEAPYNWYFGRLERYEVGSARPEVLLCFCS